ncbi:MAG: GAF domain-containing protein [Anaerolineae bacterium]|nr:GAF domain-containing protein [Anaerolineae bacterium]
MTMAERSTVDVRKVTRELSDEILREQLDRGEELIFTPFPHANAVQPTWRIRFDSTLDSHTRGGLDLNGEAVLGRDQDVPGFRELFSAGDENNLGVSRKHALLRPTESKLYLVDLGSTNGTRINGHAIGANIPYSVANGDIVRLGRMEFTLHILKHPAQLIARQQNGHEMLLNAARAITSQLDLAEVLKQTLSAVLACTPADEVSIWLVDEQSGELFLEAGRGMETERIQRLPVADSLAGQVVQTGKLICANRERDRAPIKIKTGYLVEAVLYVPLTLAGSTFGVLSVAHREQGKMFATEDEKMTTAIAEFAAVAIQNARLYQVTARALQQRDKVLAAINFALANNLRLMANSTVGYAGLLNSTTALTDEMREISAEIAHNGDAMNHLIHLLTEAANLIVGYAIQASPVDLIEVVNWALEEHRAFALSKQMVLDFQVSGNPYLIQGDAVVLRRCAHNLIDNAIRYSPAGVHIEVTLVYGAREIILRVSDDGQGIADGDLPFLFSRYVRSEESSGIGLGLEFVRVIVEAHRGNIVARNREGGGAEFIVTLPSTLRVT